MIGAISPRPGIPLAKGVEAVAGYLLAQGWPAITWSSSDRTTPRASTGATSG